MRGGEFNSNQKEYEVLKTGPQHVWSAPSAPQQKGFWYLRREKSRKNWTDEPRSMSFSYKIPYFGELSLNDQSLYSEKVPVFAQESPIFEKSFENSDLNDKNSVSMKEEGFCPSEMKT